ncbi:pentapeptide repeat-containing protein [Nocardia asteroides]|uniref:Pentapeptide repeat-containing protein n=1 Tax=Nocardia asteroides NBRC 15531 TaxID=1110697 RepID=U5EA86_NOCAS|nr:pentapeptide repeat-containing protein [Nocardia asteroides]UGT50736.1 pentapeptide repeat-containing protein [Nocardia asteroides]GAD83388.1 hypothetical protein NCAST_19_00900 [Nocardia asteroides NBRC 15531]
MQATNNQYGLSQQVAVTDRFQKAVEALTSDEVDIRLGGIYLLERLAKDSPADHETVFAVLSAFLRTHTSATTCDIPTRTMPAPSDVAAVVSVIRRRDGHSPLDLARTCLAGTKLNNAKLTGTSFDFANLNESTFYSGDLTKAWFHGATLTNSGFSFANLTGAEFGAANLTGAFLDSTNLTDARMATANLTDALITDADLTNADLIEANLAGTNLTGTNLTGANLTNVYYNEATRWPDNYTPPKSRPNP